MEVNGVYMSTVTEAFNEDLAQVQKDLSEDGIIDEVKIKNLVDSLEAGVDVFDDVEKEILMTMNRSIPKSKPPKSQPEATTATAAAATASESKKPKHK